MIAKVFLDQVITFCGKNITHDQVVDVLGLTDRTLLSQTLGSLISRDVPICLDIIEKVFHLGYDPKQFAQDLLHHLRNLMIVKVTVDTGKENLQLEFLDLPDEEITELKKFSENLSEEDVHLLFDMTLKGVQDVVRAQDPRIVLEMLLLRLTQAPRITSIDKLLAQVTGGAAQGSTSAPKLAVPAAPPKDSLNAKWSGLLENIKRDKPLLAAKLEYAAIKSLDTEKLSLAFRKEQEFFYTQVSTKEVVAQLMELVGKYWGKPYQVEVLLNKAGEGLTSPQEEKDAAAKQHTIDQRAKIEAHPLVKEAKNLLKAKITSIKASGATGPHEGDDR